MVIKDKDHFARLFKEVFIALEDWIYDRLYALEPEPLTDLAEDIAALKDRITSLERELTGTRQALALLADGRVERVEWKGPMHAVLKLKDTTEKSGTNLRSVK